MRLRESKRAVHVWPAIILGVTSLLGCASSDPVGARPDAATEALVPTQSSEPRHTVTTADGAVWHLQPSVLTPGLFDVYRDNVQITGSGYELQAYEGNVRVKGEDHKWWYWAGGFWTSTPVEAPREVRHNASMPPSREPVTAPDGAVWRLEASQTKPGLYEVTRDNVR